EVVSAGLLQRREVEVVAQLDASLTELLRRVAAAGAEDGGEAGSEVEPADVVWVQRLLVPVVFRNADERLVEGIAVVPLMAAGDAVDLVQELVGRLIASGDAEVADLPFVTIVAAELGDLALVDLPAHLPEAEGGPERTGKDSGGRPELRDERRIGDAERHRRGGVLVVSFVAGEE